MYFSTINSRIKLYVAENCDLVIHFLGFAGFALGGACCLLDHIVELIGHFLEHLPTFLEIAEVSANIEVK